MPKGLSGEYYVFVAADTENAVYEHDDAYSNVARRDDTSFVRQWIVEPGTLTENTTWDGMLKVLGRVVVPSGITLTIMPGTILKFADTSGLLDVFGTLMAQGTSEEPIILTTWTDDSAGGDSNDDGDATSPAAEAWRGLQVTGSSAVATFEHVAIRYASVAVLPRDRSNTSLRQSVLQGNGTAINVWSVYTQVYVENTLIVDNDLAIDIGATSQVTFRNCTITGNRLAGQIGHPILDIENTVFSLNAVALTGWSNR